MENRKRNIQIKFRVTEKEKKLIEQKMALIPTQQIGAYMRKMAIDGFIINTDLSVVKEYQKELSAIGRNINMISKRINMRNSIYKEDMKELKSRLDDIWKIQRKILMSLR